MGLGRTIKIEKVDSSGKRQAMDDTIPRESLITIYINRKKICVISCSPQHITELAAGYAVSQGYIDDHDRIDIIEVCEPGDGAEDKSGTHRPFMENIPVKIQAGSQAVKEQPASYITPGCGSLEEGAAFLLPDPVETGLRIKSEVILELNRKNLAVQENKKALGGLHSAALFDLRGQLLLVREDIGRHNCMDKIIGNSLIDDMDLTDKTIFTSGRISMDLVLKAVRMKIPVLVSNSSVTHSAVSLAGKLGLTVIGYARGNRFNIYSYPERII